jgi:hypothetical protein
MNIADRESMTDLFAAIISKSSTWFRRPGLRHSLVEPDTYADAHRTGFLNVLQDAGMAVPAAGGRLPPQKADRRGGDAAPLGSSSSGVNDPRPR